MDHKAWAAVWVSGIVAIAIIRLAIWNRMARPEVHTSELDANNFLTVFWPLAGILFLCCFAWNVSISSITAIRRWFR